MNLVDIPSGATVFVDANSLVYRFSMHPRFGPPYVALFERIERQEIIGCTTTHILSETAHRLMTLEAITRFSWPQAGIGNRLRQHPAEVSKLAAFRTAIDDVLRSNMQLLPVEPAHMSIAVALSQQIGLLANDALVVAVMQARGMTNIASNDADFDRVPGLTRYAAA